MPQHTHELEPLLITTAEQAKFALGLFEAELDNQLMAPFHTALRALNFRSDPDLGFNYIRVVGCDTANQLVDEIMMHIPEGHDTSKDLITAHMHKMRAETFTSRPYKPSVSAPYGMEEDMSARPQQYYCMRGLSFHIKCVQSEPEHSAPLEKLIQKYCHVGPVGRELTATCVKGHAHLLNTRDITHDMAPFTQQGMYMPEVSSVVMGSHVSDALHAQHRRSAESVISEPPELVAMAERGTIDLGEFAVRCAAKARTATYPDAYSDAYAAGQKRKR